MTVSIKDSLTELTDQLLALMSSKSKAVVTHDETSDAFVVSIEAGEETGLLIGKKGETLTSLQVILGVLLKQKTGDWHRVVVNVGDYRQKEEDYLKNLAVAAAARAKETGQPQSLFNLNAAQRRVVHMALSEHSDVITESVGEGVERYLLVKPR